MAPGGGAGVEGGALASRLGRSVSMLDIIPFFPIMDSFGDAWN